MLRLTAALASSVFLICPAVFSAEKKPEASAAREALFDDFKTPAELDRAITSARAAGVPEQSIAEARFMFQLPQHDDAAISALLPEFLKQSGNFRLGESAIFNSREEWLSAVEYLRSIDARQRGDKEAFKKHLTEAFWLSPRQTAALIPQIERIRLEDDMRTMRFSFDRKFQTADGKTTVHLAELMKDKKVLLLHFWNPGEEGGADALKDLAVWSKQLKGKPLAIVSVHPADSAGTSAIRKAIGSHPQPVPVTWISDDADAPLSASFHVRYSPAVILVSAEGKVMFNGDPTEGLFRETLRAAESSIMPPAVKQVR